MTFSRVELSAIELAIALTSTISAFVDEQVNPVGVV